MKTYSKIVFTILPLVFVFLTAMVGTTYYFSRNALTDLAEKWLETRLDEAMDIVTDQEKILHRYNLENIKASVTQAKMDAAAQIASIEVGETGYIFAVDSKGLIVFHPRKKLVGMNVAAETWFQEMGSRKNRFLFSLNHEKSFGIYDHFSHWDWILVAVSPVKEIYGIADRMAPYIVSFSIFGAVVVSMVLMLLTRFLTRPLRALVQGVNQIARGDLKTRIQIESRDEFAHLANEFNVMARKLEQSLEALKQSEEHFRTMIENATDIVTITDANGNITYASPSIRRILGYRPEDMIEKSIFDYFHPSDRQQMRLRYKNVIESDNRIQTVEFRFRHEQGHWASLEAISNNLLDHPSVKGVVINSRDISQRKQAEAALKKSHLELEHRVRERTQELEKANQVKTEFIANMSHEIKTPLNAVLGFSEILTSIVPGNQAKSYLHAIKTAGNSLLSLINDILDLSKIESGKLEIQKVPVNITDMFDDMESIFKSEVKAKGLHFEKKLSDGFPESLLLDDIRLRQVLLNLVGNAVKFTQNGWIRLSAEFETPSREKSTGQLTIRVEDTGIGILEDNIDLIFDSFQQGSTGTNKKYGGTGLGLSICKRLVTMMEGTISVASRPGNGSSFECRLPRVEIARPGPETREKKGNVPQTDLPTFSFEKVLVVDDVPTVRFLVRELLRRVNLTCLEAENGKEGVAMAKKHMPDLILIDSKMPVMDGVTATDILKNDPVTRKIPVILLTASMKWASPEKIQASNFDGCLLKPVDIGRFYTELARWLPDTSRQVKEAPETQPDITRQVVEKMIAEHEALEGEFKTILMENLPELEHGLLIRDVRRLAADLQRLGDAFELSLLSEEGQLLHEASDVFDVYKIDERVSRLRDSLKHLA